jgi:hypothetical protein|tara:strand:- start:157 stop:405 length:249 start_codon:yes stop_codon:yes gene_type:complete
MSDDKVWVVLHVGSPNTHGDDTVAAIFSSQMGARLDSERRYHKTRVIGPIVVQQPKADEIQAKIEQLQRALVKQLKKEGKDV